MKWNKFTDYKPKHLQIIALRWSTPERFRIGYWDETGTIDYSATWAELPSTKDIDSSNAIPQKYITAAVDLDNRIKALEEFKKDVVGANYAQVQRINDMVNKYVKSLLNKYTDISIPFNLEKRLIGVEQSLYDTNKRLSAIEGKLHERSQSGDSHVAALNHENSQLWSRIRELQSEINDIKKTNCYSKR